MTHEIPRDADSIGQQETYCPKPIVLAPHDSITISVVSASYSSLGISSAEDVFLHLTDVEMRRRLDVLHGRSPIRTAREAWFSLRRVKEQQNPGSGQRYDGEAYFPHGARYVPGNLTIFASYRPRDEGGYFSSIAKGQAQEEHVVLMDGCYNTYNLCVAAIITVNDGGEERVVLGSGKTDRLELPSGGFQPGEHAVQYQAGTMASRSMGTEDLLAAMMTELRQELGVTAQDEQMFSDLHHQMYIPAAYVSGQWTSPIVLFTQSLSSRQWARVLENRERGENPDDDYFSHVVLKKPEDIILSHVRRDAAYIVPVWRAFCR